MKKKSLGDLANNTHLLKPITDEECRAAIEKSQETVLRKKLAIAVEALELYRGIAGHDCDKSETKWSAADIALKKLSARADR